MAMKGSGPADEYRIVNEWTGGFGWVAYPDEKMQRASHAFVVDGEVWVVDPVDFSELDDELTKRGEVAGVVVTFDRHKRDAAAIANRHDVPVYVPTWFSGVASKLDAPIERFSSELADTGYRTIRLRDNRFWQEVALYNEDTGALWVPESVGTVSYFLGPGEQLGVHPMLRAVPPKDTLGDVRPDRLFVGHGEGVMNGAAAALQQALDDSRKKMLGLYAKNARAFLPV
jgi:hypothetical protein